MDEEGKYAETGNDFLDLFDGRRSMHDEDSDTVSNCCSAPIYEDTDICSDCKEHCDSIEL